MTFSCAWTSSVSDNVDTIVSNSCNIHRISSTSSRRRLSVKQLRDKGCANAPPHLQHGSPEICPSCAQTRPLQEQSQHTPRSHAGDVPFWMKGGIAKICGRRCDGVKLRQSNVAQLEPHHRPRAKTDMDHHMRLSNKVGVHKWAGTQIMDFIGNTSEISKMEKAWGDYCVLQSPKKVFADDQNFELRHSHISVSPTLLKIEKYMGTLGRRFRDCIFLRIT